MAKNMMLSRMTTRMPIMAHIAPGEAGAQGIFLSQMPHAFSKRFAWANLRTALAPDGAHPSRKKSVCPGGGSGCTATTVAMEGNPVPVVFDAQNRPITVTMEGEVLRFEYGSWNIRRPPGW